jgi:hypothetical protein
VTNDSKPLAIQLQRTLVQGVAWLAVDALELHINISLGLGSSSHDYALALAMLAPLGR